MCKPKIPETRTPAAPPPRVGDEPQAVKVSEKSRSSETPGKRSKGRSKLRVDLSIGNLGLDKGGVNL